MINLSELFFQEFQSKVWIWLFSCLLTDSCKKLLDSTTCNDHDGEIYCKACYGKNFGPKGYGFAGGASGLNMDTGVKGEITTRYIIIRLNINEIIYMNNLKDFK